MSPKTRNCKLSDIRYIERGWFSSPLKEDGSIDLANGEFQADDSIVGEAWECEYCGAEFLDSAKAKQHVEATK